MAYVRTVKTSSGATAVQVVWSSRRGSRSIEHLGSARDEAQLEALKAAAAQRLTEGQQALDLGLAVTGSGGAPLEILGWQSGHLWDGLCRAFGVLGFDSVLGGDEVLRDLVLARIIEPTSKIDAERVLTETGVAAASYRTVKRRLPVIAKSAVRQALSAACAAHAGLGPASLVIFDVSTLYFETDAGDGFREPGFSRNADWNPRSPSVCSLMPPGFHWPSRRSRATKRDRHDAAGHQRVQGRPPAHRRDIWSLMLG